MKQAIVGYHRDEDGHWVAELSCGHFQHVRHDPPFTLRPWVTTVDGRESMLGTELDCKKCDRGEPQDRRPAKGLRKILGLFGSKPEPKPSTMKARPTVDPALARPTVDPALARPTVDPALPSPPSSEAAARGAPVASPGEPSPSSKEQSACSEPAPAPEAVPAEDGLVERRIEIGGRVYDLVSNDTYLTSMGDRFEPSTVELLGTLVRKSDTVLDVGANIGCTALLFAERARTVHAFEPSADTHYFLKANVERAGLKNVELHRMGLGEAESKLTLTVATADRSGGFISNRIEPTEGGHVQEEVPIRRMDDWAVDTGVAAVDLVKIDTEGFEGSVLRGATRTLAEYRPVVVAELNHFCLNAFQRTSLPDHFDLMRSIFPILLVVEGKNYLDLHRDDESFVVLFQHILHMRFVTMIGGFDEQRLQHFRQHYVRGFTG